MTPKKSARPAGKQSAPKKTNVATIATADATVNGARADLTAVLREFPDDIHHVFNLLAHVAPA
jgi:hypothetical protein